MKGSKHFIFWLVLMLQIQMGIGQKTLVLTDALKDAYKDISSLKIKSGHQKLSMVKLADPNNALVHYIENYEDFFVLFIQEDQELYQKLIKNKDVRLEKIKKSDSSSPYYLFCQAEIILQWATIKLKFDDKIGAAKDVYSAYKLLEKNKVKFPNFVENNKSLSIIHALGESVPSWVRKIMGIKGSIELGTKEIKLLATSAARGNNLFKDEIVAIYSYILFYSNNQKEEAFQLFDTYKMNHKASPIIAFLKATMAQKTGRNDLAIKILAERPTSSEYLSFYYLDFMEGKFKLNKLENDADKHILKFIHNFKGKHYIKEAYQKLAWNEVVIRNNRQGYLTYMKKCQQKGHSLLDEDVEALREANSNQIPDEVLLKSRLLYDGGYYTKAQNLLILNGKNYVNAIHDGEYYYRLARVTDALKNYVDAIEYYKLTLIKSDPAKYYACSASLQLGLIYELQKKYAEAKKYYKTCTELDAAGYSTSLHQKAEMGLDRLKKK